MSDIYFMGLGLDEWQLGAQVLVNIIILHHTSLLYILLHDSFLIRSHLERVSSPVRKLLLDC